MSNDSPDGLRILLVEDSEADAELIEYELRTAGISFSSSRVDKEEAYLSALNGFAPNLILADYSLPAFDGRSVLALARQRVPDTPLIFVTGALGEERAIELLKSGATDFVLKGHLDRLPLAVSRALEEANEKIGRRRAEAQLRRAHDDLATAYQKLKEEIRERNQAEERLRQAQKMEAIGTLAGGIAHDFNNMLAVIVGNAELALEDVDDQEPVNRRNIEQIINASIRARDLIRQILTFSRKTERKMNATRLIPLVEETFRLLRSSLPSTIEMDLEIKAESDTVITDPPQIQQILMNLSANAAYSMREKGGRLTIGLDESSVRPGGFIPDPEMQPGEYVRLYVADTGTGMSSDVQARVFEPFFTTKEPGQGTGMGLAVVYGIVKSHGGTVTVESRLDQGSIFSVFLPRTPVESGIEDRDQGTVIGGREHVLVVDDEPLVTEMTSTLLQRLGYKVTVAFNGTEAWDLFRNDPAQFDLVITDQTMPDLTGIALAEKILEVRKDLPIILCTGYSESVSEEKAKKSGIRSFLMKPLVKREIATAVRQVLERS